MIVPLGYVTSRHEDRETVNEALKMFIAFFGGDNEKYKGLKGFEYYRALIDTKRAWAKRHGHNHFENLTDAQVADDWNYYVFPNITINVFSEERKSTPLNSSH